MTTHHAYSYKMLLDPLTQLLSSDNDEEKVSHEAFKGQIFRKLKFNFILLITLFPLGRDTTNISFNHCEL